MVYGAGMNLQICFMNETASDNESQASDLEKNYNNTKSLSRSSIFSKSSYNHPYQTRPLSVNITKNDKISTVQGGKYILFIVSNHLVVCANDLTQLTVNSYCLVGVCNYRTTKKNHR